MPFFKVGNQKATFIKVNQITAGGGGVVLDPQSNQSSGPVRFLKYFVQ